MNKKQTVFLIRNGVDIISYAYIQGAQWLSGRVLDSRSKGHGFEPHPRHCVVVLEQHIYPSLVLVQPRNTRPYITERLLMGRKRIKSNKQTYAYKHIYIDVLRPLTNDLWVFLFQTIDSEYVK